MDYTATLPNEVWDSIGRRVSQKDLLNLCLVSQRCNKIFSNTELWRDATLNRSKMEQEGVMSIFSTKFSKVKTLELYGLSTEEYKALFEHMLTVNDIEEVDLEYANLQEVPPDITGHALAKVKIINLRDARLTTLQWNWYFLQLISHPTPSTEDINLSNCELKSVSPQAMGKALARIKKLKLRSSVLTADHWSCLFTEMWNAPDLQVVHLDLSYTGMDLLQAAAIGPALMRVKTINLSYAFLSTPQWIGIFHGILSEQPVVIEELILEHADLRDVPEIDLSHALALIKKVNLRSARLTPDQWLSLTSQILAMDPPIMEYIDLRCTSCLTDVPYNMVLGQVKEKVKQIIY